MVKMLLVAEGPRTDGYYKDIKDWLEQCPNRDEMNYKQHSEMWIGFGPIHCEGTCTKCYPLGKMPTCEEFCARSEDAGCMERCEKALNKPQPGGPYSDAPTGSGPSSTPIDKREINKKDKIICEQHNGYYTEARTVMW